MVELESMKSYVGSDLGKNNVNITTRNVNTQCYHPRLHHTFRKASLRAEIRSRRRCHITDLNQYTSPE